MPDEITNDDLDHRTAVEATRATLADAGANAPEVDTDTLAERIVHAIRNAVPARVLDTSDDAGTVPGGVTPTTETETGGQHSTLPADDDPRNPAATS